MAEFLAMGGYAEFVWSVYALGVAVVIYNIVSARRRMRTALENAALNAARFRNRPQSTRTENGNEL